MITYGMEPSLEVVGSLPHPVGLLIPNPVLLIGLPVVVEPAHIIRSASVHYAGYAVRLSSPYAQFAPATLTYYLSQ